MPLALSESDRVRSLVLAAHRGQEREFGRSWETVFQGGDERSLAGRLLDLLNAVTTARVTPWDEDASAALADVHRMAVAASARSGVLGDTNLVVVEHVIRSSQGWSSYLATLDARYASLLMAWLIGSSVEDEDDLAAIEQRLGAESVT